MNGKMRAAPGDNVLPLSRAISYSHEQVTDQWMEWLESSFATCAFFNAPNRRPWFLSTGRLSFFARSLFSRSRDREASIFFFFLIEISFDSRIRGDVEELYEIRVKMFVGKVTRDNDVKSFEKSRVKSPFEFHRRNESKRSRCNCNRFRITL